MISLTSVTTQLDRQYRQGSKIVLHIRKPAVVDNRGAQMSHENRKRRREQGIDQTLQTYDKIPKWMLGSEADSTPALRRYQ